MQLKCTTEIKRNNVSEIFQGSAPTKKNIEISTSMATLTQPVHNNTTTFTPIDNTLDDTTIINSAPVSKTKTATISAKISSNDESATKIANGTTSPTPQTTSQNKPPKIKLLNRSSNVASPVPVINGLGDDEGETINGNSDEKVGETKTEAVNEENLSEEVNVSTDVIVEKEKQDECTSTPPRNSTDLIARHVASQYGGEYSSSPSSTTSSLNRENSLDYKDSTGVNLHEFMVKTLKENPRDRLMLLKLEKDFTEFINDKKKKCFKYEQMTSYHRMLVHRVAAYFGLDHNVDSTGKAVVISKTPSSRAPETRFQQYCSREYTDEEIAAAPKAILMRCSSADEQPAATGTSQNNCNSGEHQFSLEDKKTKSFEEREEDYVKAKDRIFHVEPTDSNEQSGTSAVYSPSNRGSSDNSSNMSEREAAIAAVAAKTGGKPGANAKRVDRKNIADLQLPNPTSYWINEAHGNMHSEYYQYQTPGASYPGAHVIRGQPINTGDGNHVFYQPGYQATTPLTYMPSIASGGGFVPQAQMSNPLPFYYVSGGSPQNVGGTGNAQHPSVQQYYVQQTASGQILYIPKQATTNDSQGVNPQQQQQQQQQSTQQQQQVLQYQQEFNNQINNLSIEEHAVTTARQSQPQQQQLNKPRNESEKQTQHSQVTSPTSPVEISPTQTPGTEYPQPPRKQQQTVYLPAGQTTHAGQQYNPAGYPVQIYHNTNHAFPGYQDNTHYGNSSQPATPTTLHQPPPSPNTVLLQTYPSPRTPAQSPVIHQSPHQLQQTHAAAIAQMNSPRQRFVTPNMYSYQRDGTTKLPVYVPIAAAAAAPSGSPNQMAMTFVRAPYAEVKVAGGGSAGVTYDVTQMCRANKGSVTAPVVPAPSPVDPSDMQTYIFQQQQQQQRQQQQQHQQQSLLALQQHHQQQRPLMQFQPNYQQAYAYTRRFLPRQMGPNHFIRSANSVRKYRPPRHVTGNQQIRISRPNSMNTDPDQNTVSHILEVYDFPDSVVSDSDAIFEDVRSSGARILKINSSSQSTSVHGQHTAIQRPTILAIFKSAAEAQSALETVKSPYYKLRVSKKSPTHLSSSDYHPNPTPHGKPAASS